MSQQITTFNVSKINYENAGRSKRALTAAISTLTRGRRIQKSSVFSDCVFTALGEDNISASTFQSACREAKNFDKLMMHGRAFVISLQYESLLVPGPTNDEHRAIWNQETKFVPECYFLDTRQPNGPRYLDENGAVISRCIPNDESTPDPALVYSLFANGQDWGVFYSQPFLDYVSNGKIILSREDYEVMAERWKGTSNERLLVRALESLHESAAEKLSGAVLEVLLPAIYSSSISAARVIPSMRFNETIIEFLDRLFEFYDPQSKLPRGQASDEAITLIISILASGPELIPTCSGDGDRTMASLREPSDRAEALPLALDSASIRVRMEAYARNAPLSSSSDRLRESLRRLDDSQRAVNSLRHIHIDTLRNTISSTASLSGDSDVFAKMNALFQTLQAMSYKKFLEAIGNLNSELKKDCVSFQGLTQILTRRNRKLLSAGGEADSLESASYPASSHDSRMTLGKRSPLPNLDRERGHWAAKRRPGLHSMSTIAAADPFYEEISMDDGYDVYLAGVYAVHGPATAQQFKDYPSKFCFKFAQDPSSCTDINCPFTHIPKKEIIEYVRNVINGSEVGIPLFIPKRFLLSVVPDELATQYLDKKRFIFKRGKESGSRKLPLPGSLRHRDGVYPPSSDPHVPDRTLPASPAPSSGGIPIRGVHPGDSANSNSISFNCESGKWDIPEGNQEFCLVVDTTQQGHMSFKGMCLEGCPGRSVRLSISGCSNSPLKTLIQEIFIGPVQTRKTYSPTGYHVRSHAFVVGAQGRVEPSIAILDQGQAVAFGLPDTGSGLTIIRQGIFGEGQPLQHCVRFKVPLEGLGNFKVIGIGGDSPITHICWVTVEITCEAIDGSGHCKRHVVPFSFTGFLTDVQNVNAVLFSNKTIASMGGFVVPYEPSDSSRPAHCQLRLVDVEPRPLAMHPILVHAAEQAIRDNGTAESLRNSLSSLLHDHKRV